MSPTKVTTDECLSFLKSGTALGMDLSDREMCILATTVVEIKQKYKIDPMQTPLVIQVAQSLDSRFNISTRFDIQQALDMLQSTMNLFCSFLIKLTWP